MIWDALYVWFKKTMKNFLLFEIINFLILYRDDYTHKNMTIPMLICFPTLSQSFNGLLNNTNLDASLQLQDAVN